MLPRPHRNRDSMSSNTILGRAGLVYVVIGALLTLWWHGFHLTAMSVVTVLAWPAFVALHFVVGLVSLLITTVALLAAIVIGGVFYLEVAQRRWERRAGLRRQGGTMIYVGAKPTHG